jgi:hypothetical protein
MTRISVFLTALTSFGLALSAQADDISAREARRLASTYMLSYITGCGGVTEPVSHDNVWEVPLRFGVAGTPRGAIHVDRATGTVSYSYAGQHYPTVSPKQLAQKEYELVHRR